MVRFAFKELPDLVRSLPSRTDVQRREWEGGFQGRLDVQQTLRHHWAGRRTHFVTRSRRRRFDLPENVLVRAVAGRLLAFIVDLRESDLLTEAGWGEPFQRSEGALRHLLGATVLREVPDDTPTQFHVSAASNTRHPCYAQALGWHRAFAAGIESSDPSLIARIVSKGALQPLDDATRFEIAVLIRLLQALVSHISDGQYGRWVVARTLIEPHRHEVACLEREDGFRVRVFYNQAHLDPGPSDLGARHYLHQRGRLRPDITVVAEKGGKVRATVIEIKLSDRPDYILQGYHEAVVYRWEYAPVLTGWPKAILVASSSVPGLPRREDDVVAVDWERWVPTEVIEGLLAG